MTDAAVDDYSREGALVLGGAAAILLQLADPVVARGVAAHSAFAEDPVRRLRHTLTFVYAAMIGTDEDRAAAARFVNRAHTAVPGAEDPAHQLWVAATLYRVGMEVHERLFGALTGEVADAVYARSARLGTVLQLPAEVWPADREQFDVYWYGSLVGAPAPHALDLAVGEEARAVARQLLHPSAAAMPWWGRLAMPLVRRLTPGLLPPSIAADYGLDPAAGRRLWRGVRILVRLTPRRLRQWPSRHLLAALRA